MDRSYVTFLLSEGPNAPTIDLLKGSNNRVVIFAERADPQPPGLPEGLVAVVLPPNCYVDTAEQWNALAPPESGDE